MSISRVAAMSLGLGVVLAVAASTRMPETPRGDGASVQDWTTRHMIFSNPGTEQEAIEQGEYDRWLKIVSNPRYIQQAARRNEPAVTSPEPDFFPFDPVNAHKNRIKKDWSEDLGSGATVGMGNFPGTYTTGGTSCNDFAVFNTSLAGSATQASIVAFKNLYTSCNGGTPTVDWAYNTGGTITNSVVLYTDGVQVAFVQTVGGVATLSILRTKPSNGTISAPATPTAVANSAYVGCTAPCMTSITFKGNPKDTHSAPYYDETSDEIFVGDDAGALHLFYNIFNEFGSNSAPREIQSVYWPKQVSSAALASPVYDSTTSVSTAYVGDYALSGTCGAASCGYLYAVGTAGELTKSAQLDHNMGIRDAPLIDVTAGYLYAFVGDDGSTNCSSGPCAGVFQFKTTFSSGSGGTEVTVGPGYDFMMSGAFDNTYYTSNGVGGNLYVVGSTGAVNNTLYQIPIFANTMQTSIPGPVVSTNHSSGSYDQPGLQITEFYNTAGTTPHDYIFLSVPSYGTTPCAGQSATVGCLLGYDVTLVSSATPLSSSTAPTGALPESGGTSGIIIDNGAAGASNIYFSTLLNQSCTGPGVTGTGGCAVQTTQSAP